MLVGEAVARVVDEVFDSVLKAGRAANAAVFGGHFLAMLNGVNGLEYGDARRHGVAACGKRARKYAVMPRVQAVRRTFETDMADEARQRHGRPSAPFAVAAPLRTPTRQHVEASGVRDAVRKRTNVACRDAANAFGPFGRFRDAVIAFARHVVVIRHVLAAESFRHGRLVEADAVCMQKVQVNGILLDKLPRNCRHKRRIGAGRDGQPFDVAHDRFGLARVDDDDARALLLCQAPPLRADVCAAVVGDSGVRAEGDHEVGRKRLLKGAAVVGLHSKAVFRGPGGLRA